MKNRDIKQIKKTLQNMATSTNELISNYIDDYKVSNTKAEELIELKFELNKIFSNIILIDEYNEDMKESIKEFMNINSRVEELTY